MQVNELCGGQRKLYSWILTPLLFVVMCYSCCWMAFFFVLTEMLRLDHQFTLLSKSVFSEQTLDKSIN